MHLPIVEMLLVNPSARILVLAAIGLAALVMIHVLAQDFNRIRGKPGRLLLPGAVFKRDTDGVQRFSKPIDLMVSSIFL